MTYINNNHNDNKTCRYDTFSNGSNSRRIFSKICNRMYSAKHTANVTPNITIVPMTNQTKRPANPHAVNPKLRSTSISIRIEQVASSVLIGNSGLNI